MNSDGKSDQMRIITDFLVREVVGRLLNTCGTKMSDLALVYRRAVGLTVAALLSGYNNPGRNQLAANESDPEERLTSDLIAEIGHVDPEDVGHVYEYLRGFRLGLDSANEPYLDRQVTERRNQGLFYTPRHIVRHIVSKTLDELETSNPEDLLDLRILDPAVGGGLFLAEALDQLTQRILCAAGNRRSHLPTQVDKIRERFTCRLRLRGVKEAPDVAAAIRAHVVDKCLYGVDLDPIAVNITRAVLIKRAFQDLPVIPDVEPNVREGNSLIGEDGQSDGIVTDAEATRIHATAYAGKCPSDDRVLHDLREKLRMVHWPLEYPEVFQRNDSGFDAIVGNPPYEIVSVRESGIEERRREQSYFRVVYGTCIGKINTYRLMLERGLRLLKKGGVLGFIVPATLLADSTASKLRQKILEESQVRHAVVIPERARIFQRVTQALLILVARKGRPTRRFETVFWDGTGPIERAKGVEVSRQIIAMTNTRIPMLRSDREKALLETLLNYPPLRGDGKVERVASVHQGEINLTTHRRFITCERTRYPLIRGEHLQPFYVNHPSGRTGRLDWLSENFLDEHEATYKSGQGDSRPLVVLHTTGRKRPWAKERIAIGRVVNMATATRLKAARVAPGQFLGDMTNSVTDMNIPTDYLLGLLNSKVLNWRIKLTSTNNYLSAAEIEALPIPRARWGSANPEKLRGFIQHLEALLPRFNCPLGECIEALDETIVEWVPPDSQDVTVALIEWAVASFQSRTREEKTDIGELRQWRNLVDTLVLKLFGIEDYAAVIEI